MKVLETYSPERIADVLASTVQQRAWDGRFSQDNRLWANGIDTSHIRSSPYRCICESHPAVLDGFISMFRHAILEQKRDEKPPLPRSTSPKKGVMILNYDNKSAARGPPWGLFSFNYNTESR